MNQNPASIQPQPAQRPGEVVVAEGRWNEAALRRLVALGQVRLEWVEGPLGYVATSKGIVVGKVGRHRPEHPFTLRLEGFEWWHPPTKVIQRWHYTPVFAIDGVAKAKAAVQQLFDSRPQSLI